MIIYDRENFLFNIIIMVIVNSSWNCTVIHLKNCGRNSCGRADSVMDSHTTVSGFKTRLIRYTFYRASD